MATISMKQTAVQDLINGTREILQVYSYQYYAQDDANTQLPQKINLTANLLQMQHNLSQITSLPEAARAISRLLSSLNDGHTALQIDCATRVAYDAFLPLANVASDAHGEALVIVHPEYEQFLVDRKINNTTPFALQKSLAGATVLEIDGQPTDQYLRSLISDSDIFFGNIDPQTRYNQLFVNLRGHPTPRLGYGVALTSESRAYLTTDTLALKLAFENGTQSTVELPWRGIVDTEYHKYKDKISFPLYFSDFVCMNNSETGLKNTTSDHRFNASGIFTERQVADTRLRPVLYDTEFEFVRDAPYETFSFAATDTERNTTKVTNNTSPPSSITAAVLGENIELISSLDSGMAIYHFRNTTVGVIYYTNFADDLAQTPGNRSDAFAITYRNEMRIGLQELKRRGVVKLLIEVSGNNGGRIELGSVAMLSLFPQQYPGFGTIYRSNPAMYDFLTGTNFSASFCTVNGTTYPTLDALLATRNKTIEVNGVSASYTQLTVDNLLDGDQWSIVSESPFPSKDLFAPADMLIITNGKCASTCAQVIMYMQNVHGVKSVGFGGLPGEGHLLQTVGGVRGAQVVKLLDPHEPAFNAYNFSMRVTQATMNFKNAIDYDRQIPTEYVTRNVDYSYQHTRRTFNNFAKTWEFVARTHFAEAMSTEPVAVEEIDEWKAFEKYPADWFTRLQALEDAMNRNPVTSFPAVLNTTTDKSSTNKTVTSPDLQIAMKISVDDENDGASPGH